MLLDGGKPKVSPQDLESVLEEHGIGTTERKADFGVVIGGDGRFSRYGRTEDIPLLFVGVRSKKATGSKAFLAQAYFDELPDILEEIKRGEYRVEEYRRLEVLKNGRSIGEVFTDVYLQRGSESTCLRYRLKARGDGVSIEEEAIGDGVVVTTAPGSTGYYSYPDRIGKETMDPGAYTEIGRDQIGVCHINPTYTERSETSEHPLRYTLPWGSRVELGLFRKAEARLYGATDNREGVRVRMGDRVEVRPGKKISRVITLGR